VQIDSDYQYSAGSCTADDLLAAVLRAGYSNTRARRAVLEALCAAGGQATPVQLLALGRIYQPALGLVTVYRTLEILNSLGLVRKLHLEEGCSTYALSPASVQQADGEMNRAAHAPHEHSHHVICQRCRRATEFAGCDIDMVVAAVEAQTGYRVREHWLEMFGLCPECLAAAEEARRLEVAATLTKTAASSVEPSPCGD
jgi:Fe2+ or Zn2+ uptake regulation protein